MTTADGLLISAAACACFGIAAGNRTPIVLLLSLGLCLLLDYAGAEFNLAVWVLIDVVVAALIIRRGMNWSDVAIVALFPAAWVFYFMPSSRFDGANAVVCAQLVLTFPFAIIWLLLAKAAGAVDDDMEDFDLRVAP